MGYTIDKSSFDCLQTGRQFPPPLLNRPDRFRGRPSLHSFGTSAPVTAGGGLPEREADYSRPASAEVQNAWNYTSISRALLWRVEGKLYFTITFRLQDHRVCKYLKFATV